MIGSRDEAAKDDGIRALGYQRLQDLDECRHLGVPQPPQAIGLIDEAFKRSASIKAWRWLNIKGFPFIVEELIHQALRVAREAVAQRARGGGWRRAHAAHQCERAPEGQSAARLVRTLTGDRAQAVVEHGFVKRT